MAYPYDPHYRWLFQTIPVLEEISGDPNHAFVERGTGGTPVSLESDPTYTDVTYTPPNNSSEVALTTSGVLGSFIQQSEIDQVAISFWMKIPTSASNAVDQIYVFEQAGWIRFWRNFGGAYDLVFSHQGGPSVIGPTGSDVRDDTWHHYFLFGSSSAHDGRAQMLLIDGQLSGESTNLLSIDTSWNARWGAIHHYGGVITHGGRGAEGYNGPMSWWFNQPFTLAEAQQVYDQEQIEFIKITSAHEMKTTSQFTEI